MLIYMQYILIKIQNPWPINCWIQVPVHKFITMQLNTTKEGHYYCSVHYTLNPISFHPILLSINENQAYWVRKHLYYVQIHFTHDPLKLKCFYYYLFYAPYCDASLPLPCA